MGDLAATATPSRSQPVRRATGQLLLAWVALLAAGLALGHVVPSTLVSPGTVLMVQLIKAAVARHRPPGSHLTAAEGFSWPSGHASSSAALYGALLLIANSHPFTKGKRARLAQICTAILLGLIGLSRVYLGVHYVSDVLAAWLLVDAWLTALWHTLLKARREI